MSILLETLNSSLFGKSHAIAAEVVCLEEDTTGTGDTKHTDGTTTKDSF